MKNIILAVLMTLVCLQALTAKAGMDVVIGDENRETAPVLEYPYSSIGRISTTSGRLCTGFLVSESVVVTNAHCVINDENKTIDPSEIEFYLPSQNKVFQAKRVKMAKRYLENKKLFDFSFIEVDKDAGHISGYFGTRGFDSSLANKDILQLSGFSSDYKLGWELFRQNTQCRGMASGEGLIMHTCDMQEGSSGSPVFIKKNDSYYVVGINSRQSDKGNCSALNSGSCFNLAVPFQQIGLELIDFQKNN